MARLSVINREEKRRKMVKKFAAKRLALKGKLYDAALTDDERQLARAQLEALPRNASECRLRNRCQITGRPRGVYRKFPLGRVMRRDLASRGQIPGMVKSSW